MTDQISPLPWHQTGGALYASDGIYVFGPDHRTLTEMNANTAYIVRACNSYPRMLAALKAYRAIHLCNNGDLRCDTCRLADVVIAEATAHGA